jgi:hypothetical protein
MQQKFAFVEQDEVRCVRIHPESPSSQRVLLWVVVLL